MGHGEPTPNTAQPADVMPSSSSQPRRRQASITRSRLRQSKVPPLSKSHRSVASPSCQNAQSISRCFVEGRLVISLSHRRVGSGPVFCRTPRPALAGLSTPPSRVQSHWLIRSSTRRSRTPFQKCSASFDPSTNGHSIFPPRLAACLPYPYALASIVVPLCLSADVGRWVMGLSRLNAR